MSKSSARWCRLSVIGLSGFLIALTGCGGPRLTPAGGTITLDGKPLAGASVQFTSKEFSRPASGATDAQGSFTLAYFNKRGAPAGSYAVSISKRGPSPTNPQLSIETLPGRYNHKSQLTAKIERGQSNQFTFALTSEPDPSDPGAAAPPPRNQPPPNDELEEMIR